MLSSYNNNIRPNVIDTLSNSVLQNVTYNTVPYNTFLNFIHPVFIQDNQLQLHVNQSYQVSFWHSMREKSFLEKSGIF